VEIRLNELSEKEKKHMSLKSYIWGVRLINLISLSALALVVYNVDPEKSGLVGFAIFCTVLFFVLSGIFNLILLWIRRITLGKETAFSDLSLSFRQGILLAVLAIGILILQKFRILVWWDGLMTVAGVFLIELYFLSRK
jgi:hypothetical protein